MGAWVVTGSKSALECSKEALLLAWGELTRAAGQVELEVGGRPSVVHVLLLLVLLVLLLLRGLLLRTLLRVLLLLRARELVELLLEESGLHVLNALGPLALEEHLLKVGDGELGHVVIVVVHVRLVGMGRLHSRTGGVIAIEMTGACKVDLGADGGWRTVVARIAAGLIGGAALWTCGGVIVETIARERERRASVRGSVEEGGGAVRGGSWLMIRGMCGCRVVEGGRGAGMMAHRRGAGVGMRVVVGRDGMGRVGGEDVEIVDAGAGGGKVGVAKVEGVHERVGRG